VLPDARRNTPQKLYRLLVASSHFLLIDLGEQRLQLGPPGIFPGSLVGEDAVDGNVSNWRCGFWSKLLTRT
jgi:hypothetical protein